MHYIGISTYQFIPYYSSVQYTHKHTHTHTHARIHVPYKDSEPTGLKVDTAMFATHNYIV